MEDSATVNLSRKLVKVVHNYDKRRTWGYLLMGEYHVKHMNFVKTHVRLMTVLYVYVVVAFIVGVWNVTENNDSLCMMYLPFIYFFSLVYLNWDIENTRKGFMQFETVVNLFLAIFALGLAVFTAPLSVTSMCSIHLCHHFSLGGWCANHPKISKNRSYTSEATVMIAYASMGLLIYAGKSEVEEVEYAFTFGERRNSVNTFYLLVSNITGSTILSIKHLYSAYSNPGYSAIKFNVEFVSQPRNKDNKVKVASPSTEGTV
mmetsp:Transcript_13800/g.15729  ORF Transcript_13800/g.15729 Transcript_13800/m.15729 type:complete len:260 (-) Transcript_13800:155-934(-)